MNLNVFDMNLLRILDALLTERSVSRAAVRLGLSQSATSGRLAILRSHFNDPLLIRCGLAMELTPRAQALAQPVHDLIRQMQLTLNTDIQFDVASAERLFRIAASDYVIAVVLPGIIAEARKISPGLSFQIEPIMENSWGLLSTGELDLCITTRPAAFLPGDAGAKIKLNHELVLEDGFVCLVDQNHPSVDHELSIELFSSLPQVMVRFGRNMRTSDQMAWHTAGFEPSIVAAVPSFLTAAQLVPGTDMLAMIPRRLARLLMQQLPVKFVECPIQFPLLIEMMVWHHRTSGDPAHEYLRERIRKTGQRLRHNCQQ